MSDPPVVCCCCDGTGLVEVYGACPLCDGAGSHGTEDGGKASDLIFTAPPGLLAVAQAVAYPGGLASEGSACVVEVIAGKGKGLCTVGSLRPGSLILAEAPLVTLTGTEAIRSQVVGENGRLVDGASTSGMRHINELFAQDERLIHSVAGAVEQLEVAAQDEFLDLADSFCDEAGLGPGVCVHITNPEFQDASHLGKGYIVRQDGADCFVVNVAGQFLYNVKGTDLAPRSKSTLGGIFLTNAVSCGGDDDVSCVYQLSSRINHSCRPNAVVVEVDMVRHIFAVDVIAPGSEINISYIEDFGCRRHTEFRESVRSVAATVALDTDALLVGLFKQQLFVKWGFWCCCARCALMRIESDEALARWSNL